MRSKTATTENQIDILCRESKLRSKPLHNQVKKVCQLLEKTLKNSTHATKGQALVGLLLNKTPIPKETQLYNEVEKLKELITIFNEEEIKTLPQLARGKTAKVFVDPKKATVYKLIEVEEGLVGGTFPINIRIRPEDKEILITGCKSHGLIQTLQAICIANDHNTPLFTEIRGITNQGDLIISQPYVENLKSIEIFDTNSQPSKDIKEAIKSLNMMLLGDIGSPFALARVNNKYVIFDDLHGENVLLNAHGKAVLVDSLATRYLTPKEITLLSKYINKFERTTCAKINKPTTKKSTSLENLSL